uniref:30S ribosomal protein S4 n=1 Tax=Palpitomonas bilix TaxID=652834 RepID=A0A1E1GHP8_9EUKA|nr:30S ribosomal protein S4 [Palpitomonas bilix]YP_009317266.1 30S ribosomal protein S4 [Palpitomonas bilix]BAV82387.1 30S ribosomal protein S4 [Palpitomonas bilix]BAV82434.1 30S ribosomal protein S4 [Palpitomonas bilix]
MTKILVGRKKLFKRLHEKSVKNKLSLFGKRLLAKQFLRYFYGNLLENQFKSFLSQSQRYSKASRKTQLFFLTKNVDIRLGNIYLKSFNKSSTVSADFISLLERRLDLVLYRAKFVKSVFEARQMINHGCILVNGTKVTSPGFILNLSDIVQIDKKYWKSSSLKIFNNFNKTFLVENPFKNLEKHFVNLKDKLTCYYPTYIIVNYKFLSLVVVGYPKIDNLFVDILSDLNLVIEYYNRV